MRLIVCVAFNRNYIQYNLVTSIITISGIVIANTNGCQYTQKKIPNCIFDLETYTH